MTTIEKLRKASPLRVGRFAAFFVMSIAAAAASASPAAAASVTILYSFTGGNDGGNPNSGLKNDTNGTLYGATVSGGMTGQGVVFSFPSSGGTSTTTLFDFASTCATTAGTTTGAAPTGTPIPDPSGNVYGTAPFNSISNGVGSGNGIVYKLIPTGTGTFTCTALRALNGSTDGSNPSAGLFLDSSNNLWGTAFNGGASNDGTVFKLSESGTGFTTVFPFNGSSNGSNPFAALVADSSNNLWGTAFAGGSSDNGTVFMFAPTSTTPTIVARFTTVSNGTDPHGGVVFDSSGNVYGTTFIEGSSSFGVVFKITPSGTYSVLHNFAGGTSDGSFPRAGLTIDSSGNLYGTTSAGGTSGLGTVFELAATGTGSFTYSILHNFAGGTSDGASPFAALLLFGGNLYSTTTSGGTSGMGTIFEVTLP